MRARSQSVISSFEFRMRQVEARMMSAHGTHLGYPYNLIGKAAVPDNLSGYLINNLGDPYAGSHYGSQVCDLERESVEWMMRLWGCGSTGDYWGSIGASGTEGNFWALYLAREALPDARLIYSRDAHYSIPKAARILNIDASCVESHANGEMDIEALDRNLAADSRPVILALTCGTTVKGAHDDIAGAIACLEANHYGPSRRFIHVDGALNALVLPFAEGVPDNIQPTFAHPIDSVSTSGHKMIGTPMPCGVLVARREHVDRVASAVAYLRSNDTTLMGSRNGHAALAIWARLIGHGAQGYRNDVRRCLANASWLAARLRHGGVPVLLNHLSLTAVFPQPSEEIVQKYQLACNLGEAHAIVMPNVTGELLGEFASDYLNWWSRQSGQQPAA